VSLPTEKDIAPFGDLDGNCAIEHFLGKTVQDIVAELGEHGGLYQEDLMWMGPKAFCFYLPAVLEYLERQRDWELALHLPAVLGFRLEHDADEIRPSIPTIVAICNHLVAQDDDYVEPTYKVKLRGILERISRLQ
jgi:hypothetical protein